MFRIRGGRAESFSPGRIPRKDVYQIYEGHDETLWLGFYEGGIQALGPANQRIYDARDGLAGGAVQAIQEGLDGDLWIGTTQGLSRLRNGRVTTWTTQDGLPQGGVSGILADTRTGLWLLTDSGLFNANFSGIQSSRKPESHPFRHSWSQRPDQCVMEGKNVQSARFQIR